jgi:hypothetical protein
MANATSLARQKACREAQIDDGFFRWIYLPLKPMVAGMEVGNLCFLASSFNSMSCACLSCAVAASEQDGVRAAECVSRSEQTAEGVARWACWKRSNSNSVCNATMAFRAWILAHVTGHHLLRN